MRSPVKRAIGVGALCGATACVALAAIPSRSERSEPPALSPSGISLTALDRSVDACDDFYLRACGGFIAGATPTDATPSINLTERTFNANLDRSLAALFAQDVSNGDELARLKTFHASCLATGAADVAAVKDWLARIDAARSPDEFQTLIRALSIIGVDPFFSYGGQPDRTRWSRYRGELHNAFLWADQAAVERSFAAAGQAAPEAKRDAAAVVAMVTALRARRADRYDAKAAENPRSLSQLEQLAPAIDWRNYFKMVGAPPDQSVNLTSPAYLRAVERELTTRPPAELRAFLRWSFLFSLRGELPAPYDRAFGDIGPALRVQLDNPAGRCRDATVRAMGVEFSRQYATRILGWQARDAARRIAAHIKRAVVASIADDRWLSASARRATADKLARTDLKIGFPDQWPAVGAYPLDRAGFFGNVIAARTFEQRRNWDRASRTRSRAAWEMIVRPWVGDGMAAARLVVPNGYPDALSNSLVMTAAFLGPPRFDPNAPLELNYATFGAVFAHEFVHVAEAHMFGPDGSDRELWSGADIKAAAVRGQCVIDQAKAYQPLPGIAMPGERQYGENVADYGGVRLAYQALAARLGSRIDRRDADGTSPAQRFFYRYAQNYCTAQTNTNLRQSVASDGHAPPAFRVNGPLFNLPAFGRAFSCKPGANMMRPAAGQCRVW